MTASSSGPFRLVMASILARSSPRGGSGYGSRRPEPLAEWISSSGGGQILCSQLMPQGERSDVVAGILFAECRTSPGLDLESLAPAALDSGSVSPTSHVSDADSPGTDLLAFYASPRHTDPVTWMEWDAEQDWGIFLTTGGIETLARQALVPSGHQVEQALEIAAGVLHRHELFHHLVDAAVASLERRDGVAKYDLFRAADMGGHGYNELEEALANAFAIQAYPPPPKGTEAGRLTRESLVGWMQKQPAGYRDVGRFLSEDDFRRGCADLMAQISGTSPKPCEPWDLLLLDTGFITYGRGNYPLHLVESLGSAHHNGLWQFDQQVT